MKTWPLLSLALLPLAGCVTEPDPWLASGAGHSIASPMAAAAGNRSVPIELAWARIGGLDDKPLSVRSLSGEGTLIQQVAYPNRTTAAGENLLTIEKGPVSLGRIRKAPTTAEIAADMRRVLPGLAMSVDQSPRRNAFGPYGVASGALPGGGACVFAWQTIADWTDASAERRQGAVVRLRYCDPAATKESMLDLLSTLSPSGGVYAYPGVASQMPRAFTQHERVDEAAPASSRPSAGRVAMSAALIPPSEASVKPTPSVVIPLPNG
jgi:Cellulose biosynthesis protein BcsN